MDQPFCLAVCSVCQCCLKSADLSTISQSNLNTSFKSTFCINYAAVVLWVWLMGTTEFAAALTDWR